MLVYNFNNIALNNIDNDDIALFGVYFICTAYNVSLMLCEFCGSCVFIIILYVTIFFKVYTLIKFGL